MRHFHPGQYQKTNAVDHVVQPASPLGRIPPQQPIPTAQVLHRRLPSQRPQEFARAPIRPDTSGWPPLSAALPDNDVGPATGATHAVAPSCRPTPSAAADTGLTARPRSWLHRPCGHRAGRRAREPVAGGGNRIHPWRSNSVNIASAERTFHRPLGARHCHCAHRPRAKPERPA